MSARFVSYANCRSGVVAVFEEFNRTFRLNTKALEDRIRNLQNQSPEYCPHSDSAVLTELQRRNDPLRQFENRLAALPGCADCQSEGTKSPAKYSVLRDHLAVSLCRACARVEYQKLWHAGEDVYRLISVHPAAKGLVPENDPTIELR